MKIPKYRGLGPRWKLVVRESKLELDFIRYHSTVLRTLALRIRTRLGAEPNPQIGVEQGLPIIVSTTLHSHCSWGFGIVPEVGRPTLRYGVPGLARVLRQPLRLHWRFLSFDCCRTWRGLPLGSAELQR